jgi:hypothetical protein
VQRRSATLQQGNKLDQSTREYPPAPEPNTRYVDADNAHWHVCGVVRDEGLGGFYIVQLSDGPTQEGMPDRTGLGPREFAALVRDKALRPTIRSARLARESRGGPPGRLRRSTYGALHDDPVTRITPALAGVDRRSSIEQVVLERVVGQLAVGAGMQLEHHA